MKDDVLPAALRATAGTLDRQHPPVALVVHTERGATERRLLTNCADGVAGRRLHRQHLSTLQSYTNTQCIYMYYTDRSHQALKVRCTSIMLLIK